MKIKFVLSLKKEKHFTDLGIPEREKNKTKDKNKRQNTLDGLKIVNYMNSLLMHFDLSMQISYFILKNILMLK